MRTLPIPRHDETAERIIKTHGLNFALACVGKDGNALSEARRYLKTAICQALAEEFTKGAELQRRSMEGNKLMDEIEATLEKH